MLQELVVDTYEPCVVDKLRGASRMEGEKGFNFIGRAHWIDRTSDNSQAECVSMFVGKLEKVRDKKLRETIWILFVLLIL